IKNYLDLSREELLALVDPGRLPRHMAIIMDGNGRWAAKRGLPRIAGHKKGMDVVRDVVKACSRRGIPALTLYAFSLENWRRPPREVSALMSLLAVYLQREISLMKRENIRFQTIGRLEDLPKEARAWVEKAKAETASNTGMVLDLALSYGGRWEITEAAKKMAAAINAGRIDPSGIDEKVFSSYLDTDGLPDLDLVIRTSGEKRVSNFLLWQMAYAELYFTESLWPDFTERDLLIAILDYQGRQRRFGKTSEQLGTDNGL
ncbi:MAG TPA: isoprenyl transferase, partial [Desulfobaccales bacterium]